MIIVCYVGLCLLNIVLSVSYATTGHPVLAALDGFAACCWAVSAFISYETRKL
jgi:hypothetical protein